MKAKIVFQRSAFVGKIVSCRLDYKGHAIDLEQIRHARLSSRFKGSYIQFKDDTQFRVSRRGLLRNKLSLKGTITLRVSSLSKDISFDIREVDDAFIPAEEGQFLFSKKTAQSPPVDDR